MALLLLIAAASNSAKAQNEVIRLQAGQAFTLHSKVVAVGTGLPPKYLWYRDGSPIAGATSPDYTIPAPQAVGSNVQFKRAAYTDGCAERIFTNTVTITWCNLLIDGVCWADANVAQPGTFAPRPDMYTEMYQWNQPSVAWATDGSTTGWVSNITAPAWTSTPCPEGWRLPTLTEIQALHNAGGNLSGNSGGVWVTGGNRGVATGINGRLYGYADYLNGTNGKTQCSLPSTMAGCIFLPAAGYRDLATGALTVPGGEGNYWSSTPGNVAFGHRLTFTSSISTTIATNKEYGRTIRCVQ